VCALSARFPLCTLVADATCLARHTVYLLLFITGAALLLSTVYLMLVRAFTRAIMHITLIATITLNV
jgi:hypothetical protein